MSTRIFKKSMVYFIQGEVTKRIKIGKTSTGVEERMRILQTGSPDKLIFIGASFEPYCNEYGLHCMFERYRLHGEWFTPAQEITDYIGERCFVSTSALYYAYGKIENGELTYDEALRMGDSLLNQEWQNQFRNSVASMYTKDGKNILL